MTNSILIRAAARKLSFSFCLFVVTLTIAKGEGTREMAPNQNTDINGTITNDVAALHIDNPIFNNFASFNNSNVNSRLHIHISNPLTENILLGFSGGHENSTGPNPPSVDFEYRILDPNGNVVFGPVVVLSASANINNWGEAFAGPAQVVGPTGYTATEVNALDLTSGGWTTSGDYYIEFRNLDQSGPILIDYWDVTVVENSGSVLTEKKGRLWSYNWAIFAINDFGFPVRPFNGSFYVCAPDLINPDAAFITQIDFNQAGFMPAAFNIAFNSFGTMNTGNIVSDRRSRENVNSATPEYAIFLNDPVDICETAESGEITITGISRCDKEDYCIQFISTRSGQIDLLLDFDGQDNVFTPGSADVMITQLVEAGDVGQAVCLPWDGQDGLGNFLPEDISSTIPISLSFAQGIYHFPIYDAELMSNGFRINTVRPAGPEPLLYYDDSLISVPSGTGEADVQLMGCNLPCHGWTNYVDGGFVGFGNLNTINSWWFSQQSLTTEVLVLPSSYSCSIEGPEVACEGDEVTLNLLTEFGPDTFMTFDVSDLNWVGPGIVSGNGTESITINQSGNYQAMFNWSGGTGENCTTTCSFDFTLGEIATTTIDTLLTFGDSLVVNTEVYNQDGTYTQVLRAANGCDSILTIIVDVDTPEVFLECTLTGETQICQGETTTLVFDLIKTPTDAPDPEILGINWTRNGSNLANAVTSVNVGQDGVFEVEYTWVNFINDTITQSCVLTIEQFPSYEVQIDTIINEGEVLTINGITITDPGQYVNNDLTAQGCDSIVVINVIRETSVVYYDLDDCKSSDYERFTAGYPSPLTCTTIDASIIYRSNPDSNGHSCTQGVDGGVGMCISSSDDCTFQAGDEKSVKFDLIVSPGDQEAVQLTSLRFFEKAPETYRWIVGTEGLNNYPTQYGVRVLKNGVEIFRSEDNATTTDWTSEIFNFAAIEAFKVQEPTIFSFELLGYCLIGADADVAAWDIDEISIQADCAEYVSNRVSVEGFVNNSVQQPLANLNMELQYGPFSYQKYETVTDQDGKYAFDNVLKSGDYLIKPVSDDDYLNGVSTLDLIYMQRHILGIELLKSPYQLIAADANKSQEITAIDILELKKLILGIQDVLPDNDSWRFVKANEELNLNNPFTFEEVEYLNNLSNDKLASFIGVKIGDINNDNITSTNAIEIGKRNRESINLVVAERKVSSGEMTQVILNFDNSQDIIGFQMALQLNGLNIVDIKNSDLVENVDYRIVGNQILFAVNDAENIKLSESIILDVVVKENGNLSEMLTISSTINSEVYVGENLKIMPIQLEFNSTVSDVTQGMNYPNPFREYTDLVYIASGQKTAKLNCFDVSGKLICSKNLTLEEGQNLIRVTQSDLSNTFGLIVYEIKTDNEVVTGRMISIK